MADKFSLTDLREMAKRGEDEAARLQGKFDSSTVAKTKLGKYGDMETFDSGLLGRIGRPDHNFLKAVYHEHCVADGCNTEFTAHNYNITTTPSKEFWTVVGKLDEKTFYLDESVVPDQPSDNRPTKSLKDIMDHELAKKAKLTTIEVIVGRSVSGPLSKSVFRITDIFCTKQALHWSHVQKVQLCDFLFSWLFPFRTRFLLGRARPEGHLLPDQNIFT